MQLNLRNGGSASGKHGSNLFLHLYECYMHLLFGPWDRREHLIKINHIKLLLSLALLSKLEPPSEPLSTYSSD